MVHKLLLVAFVIVGCLVVPARAAIHTAENETLTVRYDDSINRFSLTEKTTGKVVVSDGQLLEKLNPAAQAEPAVDAVFGAGRQIEIKYADGTVSALQLYPKLPFLLVKTDLHNATPAQVDIRKIVPAVFTIDLGKSATELKTIGTAGLTAPDQHPGSYLFLTCADPATRRGIVAGWLTEDRGSGVVFSTIKDEKVRYKAQIDYGNLRIDAGKSARLETLAIGVFDDARIGEESYADAVKQQYQIKLRPRTAVYCTWYAEGPGHGAAGNEKTTIELAKFAAKELKPFGLGVIQIDSNWQDGPEVDGPARGFERVRPNGPYAHGITPVAAEVNSVGMQLGLWWLPFGRAHTTADFKDRQDWFVKKLDGSVLRTHSFGGTCLDLTNPQVQEHLAAIAKSYRDWGVTYYKMDGLFTGVGVDHVYINDGYKDDHLGDCLPFHDPAVTNIEMFRDGLKLLRRSAGDDVFFSGCCASQNMRTFGGSIGLVDSMRIGPDFNHDGQGTKTGPLRGSRLYFMNGKIWWNDPDPAKVRASNAGSEGDPGSVGAVTLEQARLTSSWVALTGQFFLISDWLPALPAERLDILKRTMLSQNATARPVDYFDSFLPTTWLVTDTHQEVRRDVIGVFNQEDSKLDVKYTCDKLGLNPNKTYYAFDFWGNHPLPPFKGEFKTDIAPHSCRVIAVRAAEGHPLLLSTSRHVTQGMVDVTGETWHNNMLSSVSQVIAGDSYELRIAGLADGNRQWKAISATVSAEDQAAGVTIAQKKDPGLVRITILSSTTRAIKWTVAFAAQPRDAASPFVNGLQAVQPDGLTPPVLTWEGSDAFYDISRDGKVIAAAHYGLSYVDESTMPGNSYVYTVAPSNLSAPHNAMNATLKLTTKSIDPGPVPPLPEESVMSLKPLSVVVGYGTMQAGKSMAGRPLTLGAKVYQDGVGMHAKADVAYARKPEWKRFVAVAGIDEEMRSENQSSILCEVVAEDAAGKKQILGKSPILKFGKVEQWNFNVQLPDDCRKIHLVVDDAGDGIASDHADWVNAGFRKN